MDSSSGTAPRYRSLTRNLIQSLTQIREAEDAIEPSPIWFCIRF